MKPTSELWWIWVSDRPLTIVDPAGDKLRVEEFAMPVKIIPHYPSNGAHYSVELVTTANRIFMEIFGQMLPCLHQLKVKGLTTPPIPLTDEQIGDMCARSTTLAKFGVGTGVFHFVDGKPVGVSRYPKCEMWYGLGGNTPS